MMSATNATAWDIGLETVQRSVMEVMGDEVVVVAAAEEEEEVVGVVVVMGDVPIEEIDLLPLAAEDEGKIPTLCQCFNFFLLC